jgi:hypothetical protein
MVKKHMKKCSPSLAIKEMQIKTMLRFHFTSVRSKNVTFFFLLFLFCKIEEQESKIGPASRDC